MIFLSSKDDGRNKKPGFFERMRQAIGKTRSTLVARLESALGSQTKVDENLMEELEGILLGADLGVRAASQVLAAVRERQRQGQVKTAEDVRTAIKDELLQMLVAGQKPLPDSRGKDLQVWMIVGVNGTGKTTSVGKIAARISSEGKKVLICAADTFRPAAIEQLEVWAERSGSGIIKTRAGSDPSSVLHDALAAARARGTDILVVDTAGRLHTRSNLMQELEKMRRVAAKNVPGAPHEVLLVLDATTGQNGLSQAREFLKSAGVTGIVVTKLDGTAKGGIIFGIAHELKIPVRYVGIGEKLDDLIDFAPAEFVDSLFAPGGD